MRSQPPLPIRVLTHNIRYAINSPSKGEEPWQIRRPRLLNELRFNTLYNAEAFICLQEVLHEQLVDILSDLNCSDPNQKPEEENSISLIHREWAFIGVGRDDGHQAGEYSPILYKPSIWALQSQQTIWLSKTPHQPSKSWDAACTRILTIGVFQHRQSKKTVVAMNTHLDHVGADSRLHAAIIIMCEVDRFSNQGEGKEPLPVFLTGDFNSDTQDRAYQLLNSFQSPVRDLNELVPPGSRYGHVNTFTGFSSDDGPAQLIDFIFLGPRASDLWSAMGYAVLESRFDDGVYSSDHRAVIGDLVLK